MSQKDSHSVIFLCTIITLWEFFITKMKHHVVGNHVIGIHIKWGTAVDKIVLTFLQKMYNLHKSISVIDAWRHTIDKIHWTFLPQFWKLSLTLFCPLQLPGPAIGSLASPSSCKRQNKVGDNFQNCGGKEVRTWQASGDQECENCSTKNSKRCHFTLNFKKTTIVFAFTL